MSNGNSGEFQWQIVDRVKESADTYTYVLSPVTASDRFEFSPGQFVIISSILKRPTASGNFEETVVQRAYSIASAPTRSLIDLTIKDEKPYNYINPNTGKADGFAAYFFEQAKIGDRIRLKLNCNKQHFLWKIAEGSERDIAYWSGSNGVQPARSLIQYIHDTKDQETKMTLFYSNPSFYKVKDGTRGSNVMYYEWLINMAKKLEKFRVVFTFTRDDDIPQSRENPNVFFRHGRFFLNQDGKSERTLLKYHGNTHLSFNPICGSSGFINGVVRFPNGRIERGKGIMQSLMEVESVKPEKIDIEQFYLESASLNQ